MSFSLISNYSPLAISAICASASKLQGSEIIQTWAERVGSSDSKYVAIGSTSAAALPGVSLVRDALAMSVRDTLPFYRDFQSSRAVIQLAEIIKLVKSMGWEWLEQRISQRFDGIQEGFLAFLAIQSDHLEQGRMISPYLPDPEHLKLALDYFSGQLAKLTEEVRRLPSPHTLDVDSVQDVKVQLKGICRVAVEIRNLYESLLREPARDNLEDTFDLAVMLEEHLETLDNAVLEKLNYDELSTSEGNKVSSFEILYSNEDPKEARMFPRGSSADTAAFGLKRKYLHASQDFFIRSEEILEVHLHPLDFSYVLSPHWGHYGKTADGKTVLQQDGWRSCVAACAVMLTLDHCKSPDVEWFASCNLANHEELVWRFEKVGLKGTTINFSNSSRKKAAKRLESLIELHGSGILSVGGEVGGHVIILDAFSLKNNTATIRDPYHGWCITTVAQAILDRHHSKITFVEKKKIP